VSYSSVVKKLGESGNDIKELSSWLEDKCIDGEEEPHMGVALDKGEHGGNKGVS